MGADVSSAMSAAMQVCALTASAAFGPEAGAKVMVERAFVTGSAALCAWHAPKQFGYTGLRFRLGRWERVYDFESRGLTGDVPPVGSPERFADGDSVSVEGKYFAWSFLPAQYGPDQSTLLPAFEPSETAAFAAAFDDVRNADALRQAAFAKLTQPMAAPHYDFYSNETFDPNGGVVSDVPRNLSGFTMDLAYPKKMVAAPVGFLTRIERSAAHPDRIEFHVDPTLNVISLGVPLHLSLYAPYVPDSSANYSAMASTAARLDGQPPPASPWTSGPIPVHVHDDVVQLTLPTPATLQGDQQIVVVIDRNP